MDCYELNLNSSFGSSATSSPSDIGNSSYVSAMPSSKTGLLGAPASHQDGAGGDGDGDGDGDGAIEAQHHEQQLDVLAFRNRRPQSVEEIAALLGRNEMDSLWRLFPAFDMAQQEVFDNMRKDVFRCFCETEEYAKLVARYNAYHIQKQQLQMFSHA